MTTEIIEKTYQDSDRCWRPSLCWGAIIGGTVAAMGIHILLTMLGVGAGLAAFSPMTDANPTTTFSETAAAIWSACALVAVFFGAVIAGRFSHSVHGGFVHGIMVWSLTLIITLLLLSKGTGMALGGGLKILGAGIGMGSKAASSVVSDAVQAGIKRNGNELNSFIDEATQSIPTNSTPKAGIRAKREVGFAVMKLFAPENDLNSQDNRAAAIKALVDYTQMSQADAEATVDGWIASYKNLQTELNNAKTVAEQKARKAADEAAHDLSIAGTWTFFGLLLGLIVSAGGGVLGADFAVKRMKIKTISTTVNP
ncbi:MAG TPA: hypothetical protein VGO57_02090 [Verrucomicrobiae bacterium]|jgi:hypothetical protein